VQLDDSRGIVIRPGHIHRETRACDRGSWRNAPRDIEGKHASADVALVCLAGEKVITDGIAAVAVYDLVLVESIIFAGAESDGRRRAR
jgi:hypothetical protein